MIPSKDGEITAIMEGTQINPDDPKYYFPNVNNGSTQTELLAEISG